MRIMDDSGISKGAVLAAFYASDLICQSIRAASDYSIYLNAAKNLKKNIYVYSIIFSAIHSNSHLLNFDSSGMSC